MTAALALAGAAGTVLVAYTVSDHTSSPAAPAAPSTSDNQPSGGDYSGGVSGFSGGGGADARSGGS